MNVRMNKATTASYRHVFAPWVRTRLRTAPRAAAALGVLVLVTAFLAAAFPRAVDAYETQGLQQELTAAPPSRSVLELTTPQPPPGPDAVREAALRPETLRSVQRQATALLPEPLRADDRQSAYGVRTSKALVGQDRWLPRPDALPPEFTLAAQSGLAQHATLREGRLPVVEGLVTAKAKEVEAAVTVATAKTLKLDVGSVVHVGDPEGPQLAVRISGIVEPRHPLGSYWSVEQTLHKPGHNAKPSAPPQVYWQAGLLLAPEAAPALLGTKGDPQPYWRIALASGHLTGLDVAELADAVASLEGGPGLLELKAVAGENAALTTELDALLASYSNMRSAIASVVAVAAFGIGTVAFIALTMTGGLFAAHRSAELLLLRARGGSLRGICGRLLAESAVVALPAAGLGLMLAVLVVSEARSLPAAAAAAAVAIVACAALPVRVLTLHRRPQTAMERDDLIGARPSRRRTVAELTLLVLAVGAVAALRRRGTSEPGDHLVSAAPVLVGAIVALVLVRLYPLPLRWAARSVQRLRGAVGFLALAGAGRSTAVGAVPLLALLIALTTVAFGGSVLTGVAEARDRAALMATGSDARISGPGDLVTLPDGMEHAVRQIPGVQEVTAVQIEHAVALPTHANDMGDSMRASLVGVDPRSYTQLARQAGLGSFPAGVLKPARVAGGQPVLHAVASPRVAAWLGQGPRRIESLAGDFAVEVTAVRTRTPAVASTDFLIVDGSQLTHQAPTALLVAGDRLDSTALRAVMASAGKDLTLRLRSQERQAFTDSPLQLGAERIYIAAIAAGAGYAVLAMLIALMQSAPERVRLLNRLHTLGLSTRQGRQLLGLEALPQALLAATGGMLVGWATVPLLAPGVDLTRLALASAPGLASVDDASLRTDLWSLVQPAVGVVLMAVGVAAAQAWWAGRRDGLPN
ncbi:ABC transporter permease [Streptomyces chryseus]